MKEINSDTAIHDFPKIYNENINEYENKIQTLENRIKTLEESREDFENSLIERFEKLKASVINEIAAKYDLNRILLNSSDDTTEVEGYSSNTKILIPKLVD